MNTIYHLSAIAVAGGLGTLARYGVNQGTTALLGPHYPWGTFIVNIVGCFLFGIFSGLIAVELLSPHWRVYLLTGFLGGFTTFSAFAFENYEFCSQRHWGFLTFHLIGQNGLGVLAVLLGLFLTEQLLATMK